MNTAKYIFLATTIILIFIGAWPIAILSGTVCATLAIVDNIQTKKQNQNLKAENQRLQQELQEQAVRHAMDKAENRKREETTK